MEPPLCSHASNGVCPEPSKGPEVAFLVNKLDDDQFASVLLFASAWTEADFDAVLRGDMDVSKLPDSCAAFRPSGSAVNGDVQRPHVWPMSQIQLARLRSSWQRAQVQRAFLESRLSSGLTTGDVQQHIQQHVVMSRWGWQIQPEVPPTQGAVKCPAPVTGNVATSKHVAHKAGSREVLMHDSNPKALAERHGAWCPESLTRPLLGDEDEASKAGTLDCSIPLSPVNLNLDAEEEEDRPPKTMLYASYALALVYWMAGFIYGVYRAGWSMVDSIYFVTVTISTVGYGDMTFNQGDAFDRIFGAVYVFVGVVIISVAAGVILNELQLNAEAMVAKKMKKSEQDMAAGKVPKFDFNAELVNVISDVLKTFGVIGVALAIGCAGMMILEGWSFSDSFYFCSVTMTTVGFGDLTPQNDKSKVFVTVYILFAFGVLASSMSAVGAVPFKVQELKKIQKCLDLLGDSLEAEELQALCECDEIMKVRNEVQVEAAKEDPHVLRSEFVLWQLMKQGKLKMDDIAPCLATFDSLDTDGSGNLNQEDIDLFLAQQEQKGKKAHTP